MRESRFEAIKQEEYTIVVSKIVIFYCRTVEKQHGISRLVGMKILIFRFFVCLKSLSSRVDVLFIFSLNK